MNSIRFRFITSAKTIAKIFELCEKLENKWSNDIFSSSCLLFLSRCFLSSLNFYRKNFFTTKELFPRRRQWSKRTSHCLLNLFYHKLIVFAIIFHFVVKQSLEEHKNCKTKILWNCNLNTPICTLVYTLTCAYALKLRRLIFFILMKLYLDFFSSWSRLHIERGALDEIVLLFLTNEFMDWY